VTFGVTAAGFARPSVQQLIELMEQDQRAGISQNLDLSSDSVVGQLNGIYARHLGVAWEALETVYHSFDPDAAEEILLTMLAKLTGTERRGATQSRAACTIVTDGPCTIEAGVHAAHVSGQPDNRWTPEEDFVAAGAGSHPGIVFVNERTGPIAAAGNTITVIATPVVGWVSITNPDDAAPGRPIDTDATLRIRRQQQLTLGGSATVNAIRADLLQLTDIEAVLMFENDGDTIDGNGLPPKSFEAVVWDNDGVIDNNDIAQVIYDNKAGGIRAFGVLSGTATDPNEDTHTVHFSRANSADIFLEFDVVPREDYVGDATFAQRVATACNELFGIGDDVTFYDVLLATGGLGAQVTALRLGFTASPTLSVDLPIGIRAIARFDSGDIVVDSTP
jgi:hypothetical protein